MTRRILFETEHLVVVAQQGAGETTFVTFNEMGQLASADRFWGDAVFAKLGVPAIGVMSKAPNWFPPMDMRDAVQHIRAAVGHGRIVTYGHSQGGYGALKYGNAVGADAALAFSPQWSIDPAQVQAFDTRFSRFHHPSLANGSAVIEADLCPRNYVIYDPLEPTDAAHAARLTALPQTLAVVCPFAGHFTVKVLAQGGEAAATLRMFADRAPVPPSALRQTLRRARRRSPAYEGQRIVQLLGFPRGRNGLDRYVAARTGDQAPVYRVLVALARRDEAAAGALLGAMGDKPILDFEVIRLWGLFRRQGFTDGELHLADIIDRNFPASVTHQLHIVNTLCHCGRFDEAATYLSRAVTMDGSPGQFDAVVHFAGAMGRSDIALAFLSGDASKRRFNGHGEYVRAALRLAEACANRYERGPAFRLLHDLATDAATAPEDLRRIAAAFQKLGESSYALEIRRGLLRRTPDDLLLQAEMVESLFPLDSVAAFEEVQRLIRLRPRDGTTLHHLAVTLERNGRFELALTVAQQAVAQGANELELRTCLVRLLVRLGQRRAATAELGDLARQPLPTIHARHFSDLAHELGQGGLAVRFAELQHAPAPKDLDATLFRCRALARAGRIAEMRDLLNPLLEAVANGGPASAEQMLHMAELLGDVEDHPAEDRVLLEGLRRYPKHRGLRTRHSGNAMFAAARNAPAPGNKPASDRPALPAFLAWAFGRKDRRGRDIA